MNCALAVLAVVSQNLVSNVAWARAAAGAPLLKTLDVDGMLKIAAIGDSPVLGWRGYDKELFHLSPDGKRLVFVVIAGDPEHDARKGQIYLVEVADLLDQSRSPQSQMIAEFSSRTNDPPIANLSWDSNHSLVFAAANGDALSQIFRLDVDSGKRSQLTDEKVPISAFAVSADTKDLLVVTSPPPGTRMEEDPACLKRGCEIAGKRIDDATSGARGKPSYPGDLVSYDSAGFRRELISLYGQEEIRDCWPNDFIPGGLSPDGRYALFFCTRNSWPDWWKEYKVNERFAKMIGQANPEYAKQYFLLDIKLNRIRPVNSAPFIGVAPVSDPIWIDGGKRLLLVGAVEPLDGVSGPEREKRATTLAVVGVEPSTGATNIEFALDPTRFRYIAKARWTQNSRTLAIETVLAGEKPGPSLAWRQTGKTWTVSPAISTRNNPAQFSLKLKQTPNDRPILYASTGHGRPDRILFDPNSWLDDYKLGKVDEIMWTSRGGHQWDGSIYYPPNYAPDRQYPLVILTHGTDPGKFSPPGYARNYAAQPLASRGMVVLQMNERGLSDVGTSPKELPRSQEGIESAIDEMDRRGLIDRSRVGLVGWSRTSWYLTYLATHSDYPLKATMITDGGDIGWWAYLALGIMDEVDIDLGAPPFGKGLEPMLETAATFNLDRWRAPFLMWSAGEGLDMWDLYAGMRRLGVPVEYWYFPDGTHDLYKMSNLRSGNQLMVDWFDFWLNDHESSDPAKSAQVQRWRKLRELEKLKSATPRPPLLDWTATESTSAK